MFPECFGKVWGAEVPECKGGKDLIAMKTREKCLLYESCAAKSGHTVLVVIQNKKK